MQPLTPMTVCQGGRTSFGLQTSVALDAAFGQDDYRDVDEAKDEFLRKAQVEVPPL